MFLCSYQNARVRRGFHSHRTREVLKPFIVLIEVADDERGYRPKCAQTPQYCATHTRCRITVG